MNSGVGKGTAIFLMMCCFCVACRICLSLCHILIFGHTVYKCTESLNTGVEFVKKKICCMLLNYNFF